nr:hypothetical protein [Tanacetum cinerariifolium]
MSLARRWLLQTKLVICPPILQEEGIAKEQVQAVGVVAAAIQETVTEDSAEVLPHLLQQVLDTCSALTCRVETLEHDSAAQKLEIIKLKARVKRLGKANKGRMIDNLDKDKGIELVVNQIKDADIAETEERHAAEQTEKQAEIYNLDLDHPSKVFSMQKDDSEVQKVVEVVTTAKLITDVVTAASQVSAASATISAAKPRVETPLFEGMLAARQLAEEGLAGEQVQADDTVGAAVRENVAEDVAQDAIPSPPSHDIPSPSHEPSSPPPQPQSSSQAPPQGAEFPTHIQQVLDV